MKKNVKVAKNSEEKKTVSDAFKSFEDNQLDLYSAIFAGRVASCAVVAVSSLSTGEAIASAYDKHDTFLKAAV
ncbi:hypothetical protein SAMN04488062_10229 [Flavobacterium omnivorum]|uniref:Uncharacterized protein n=1 Tax=Flavobacterium omnivorum TaxID=178355 RepID=A0A1G7WTZ4_9FLAO|nr:hypothetical protein [Flavobacterium omnivorum]SDG75412.1 hypothetical protein SAMN04488062_10229 [Flavobacterium omnivorum]